MKVLARLVIPALAFIAPTMALADYPPPNPPFQSTPQCDMAARNYARRFGQVGSPDYNSAYDDYYFEYCPIED